MLHQKGNMILVDYPYPQLADSHLTLNLKARFYERSWRSTDPIVQLIMFMIVTLTVILHLSRRGSKFVLSITAYLLYLAFMLVEDPLATRDTNPLPPQKHKTLSDNPNDPGTIINQISPHL